jgi:hypothetical protein
MPESITPEKLCDTANAAFTRLQALKIQAQDIKTQFAQDIGLESDSYRNPFYVDYEINRAIDAARDNLGKFLVQRLNEMLIPNIPLSAEQIPRDIPDLREQFDAHLILRHIQRNYVKDAARKSYDAIFAKARRLLPRAGWKEETTLAQILKGNVLTLHKYIRSDCGANCSFERNDECDSFQKLIRIVLEEADPVTVTAGATPISQLVSARKYDEIPQPITFDSGWITKIRAHKNGKFLVTMKAESSAERVAKVLLEKPRD